jgi:hypothetical protein
MRFTDYLAIYASILSTSVFLWNVVQSRPRFKVDIVHGVESEGSSTQHGIYIVIRNVSARTVHLASAEVLYPYKKTGLRERAAHAWRFRRLPRRIGWVHTSLSYYDIDSGCPTSLEPGTSHRIFVPDEVLGHLLADASERTLLAHAQDQLWNDSYSRAFSLIER